MFRNLIPMIADKYHVVAPDFPGYGESSAPSVNDFEYSFERLATVTEKFTEKLNLSSYALFLSDIGSSVGSDYGIANMAHHGLEVEQMLGLSMRQEIISRLNDPEVRFDALLFSGGGNDIAGDQFCIWLKDSPPLVPPAQLLDTNAVSAALAILEAEFRELIDLRDQFSPQTVIFVHEYDFPPITGQGVCGEGPWLKPSLDYAYRHLGVSNPSADDEFLVVKTLMQRFAEMLHRVEADSKVQKFVVVPTQGTLSPNRSDWQNEIHPSTAGFAKIAKKFQASLASVFP